jgi:hypothetical protein
MGRPSNWKVYNNVTLHLDPVVHKILKQKARQQHESMGNIVNEAIMTWIKWMRHAELLEQKEQKRIIQEGGEIPEEQDGELRVIGKALKNHREKVRRGKK